MNGRNKWRQEKAVQEPVEVGLTDGAMTCDIDSGSVNSIADPIDAAEEIRDRLDAIIERVPDDPGAAFTARSGGT